jgi:hypothetical protein
MKKQYLKLLPITVLVRMCKFPNHFDMGKRMGRWFITNYAGKKVNGKSLRQALIAYINA